MHGIRRIREGARQACRWIGMVLLLCSACATFATELRGASSGTLEHEPPVVAEGNLRAIGRYSNGWQRAVTSTILPDGSVLQVGNWLDRNPEAAASQDMVADIGKRFTRDRRGALTVYDFPLIWRPGKAAWEMRDRPPGCLQNYYLPTATLMSDGRVFFAGGLCDGSNSAAQTNTYTATAIWDGVRNGWEVGPNLHESRTRHSATRLTDGSILLVGGVRDMALSTGEMSPVLESAELFQDGKIEAVELLSVARALHTATLLKDGSVLVSGGIDARGRALSSVELWDPKSRQWLPMPAMADARYAHDATLLPDGRVLVTGGELGAGLLLQSSEIFDPSSQSWSDAAPLPHPLRDHAMLTLSDGAVLLVGGTREKPRTESEPWVWILDAKLQRWLPAGTASYDQLERYIRPELQLLADDRVRIFAGTEVLLWQRRDPNTPMLPPLWIDSPAMARLADGQVLMVGPVQTQGGTATRSYLWDSQLDRWSDAGALGQAVKGAGGLAQLKSGRVVHVGALAGNRLVAECWTPEQKAWTLCGEVKLAQLVHTRVEVGLLEDGRMVVLPNFDEGLIYDEDKQAFAAGQLQWNTKQIVYGGPWIPEDALAVLKGDVAGSPIDVSPLAARFWEAANWGSYGLNITRAERDRRSRLARMLWEPAQRRWAYVLEFAQMGGHAQFLPDGCAISSQPLSIYDPSTKTSRKLPNPGIGVSDHANSMLVLPDGLVVIAGPPEGGIGLSFYQGKANCAGLVADADAPLMMPFSSTVIDERTRPNQGAVAAPQAIEHAPPVEGGWDMAWDQLLGYLGWVSSGALVMLLGFRLWRDYQTRRFVVVVMRRKARLLRRRLRQEVPWPVRWLMRLVVYGVIVSGLLAVVLPGWIGALLTVHRSNEAENCRANATACLDPTTALIASVPALEGPGPGNTRPHIPCRFVGVWSTVQRGAMFRVTLMDDGRFHMDENVVGVRGTVGNDGYWMVQSGHLVWRYPKSRIEEPDVNKVLAEDDKGFELLEMDGRRSRFDLVERRRSGRCTP